MSCACGDSIQLFNPWTGGDFSAMDGCDVIQNEIGADEIDARFVNSIECPTQDGNNAFYANQVSTCRSKDGAQPTKRLVRKSVRNNVCFLKPSLMGDSCKHTQRLLGGGADEGGPGSPHTNLYEYANAPPAELRETGGLFVHPYREIFRTQAFTATDVGIDKNMLHLHRADIGGHQMHFVISATRDMHLAGLVLAGGFGINDGSAAS